ncbi:Purine-cytosine permease Fcy2/21/22 [Phytophthora cactorum]|nr:Purine-cytosine permease Fcy2/21/22 [Phytophthora cactorum]
MDKTDSYLPDLEKSPKAAYSKLDGDVPLQTQEQPFEDSNSLYARLQRWASRFKIETRGIERVPEDERPDDSLLNVGSMWLAANMVISSFAIGVLGKSLFYLGSADAFLVVLFFNMVGILPVCYFSTFGPIFGLRQIVLSRFWYGWHGVKIVALFNVIACLGWSCINVIVGAQVINAVNNDVPGWAGIIIIAACTFIVTLFGYKVVHAYEFWSWIPAFIVFMIVLIEFAVSGAYVNIPMGTGTSEVGSVLSFGATVFGFAIGWTSYAADYTVYQPVNQSKVKVFFSAYSGLIVPLLFTQFLGVAVMTATDESNPDSKYRDGYNEAGAGGLVSAVIFCLVLLALSIIANNCPNIYSFAITVQVFGEWTRSIPLRMDAGGLGHLPVVAFPGYSHFESVLENFMNVIGYWMSVYAAIGLTEHFYFRKGYSGYNPADYDNREKLHTTWYVGPIAKLCGEEPYGGDVGVELAWLFAIVSYLITRPIELHYFGK